MYMFGYRYTIHGSHSKRPKKKRLGDTRALRLFAVLWLLPPRSSANVVPSCFPCPSGHDAPWASPTVMVEVGEIDRTRVDHSYTNKTYPVI